MWAQKVQFVYQELSCGPRLSEFVNMNIILIGNLACCPLLKFRVLASSKMSTNTVHIHGCMRPSPKSTLWFWKVHLTAQKSVHHIIFYVGASVAKLLSAFNTEKHLTETKSYQSYCQFAKLVQILAIEWEGVQFRLINIKPPQIQRYASPLQRRTTPWSEGNV